ncbi:MULTISPECIES: HlyD family secretion protein [unclassified Thioalkalivibrio]|uniref:HlyD family secretion protein n=1 Tax=unclassified Thioalkalivibrio TaxID=2621013 RepID=UPI0003629F40|nr:MULTISPECIES: HlyD family efflux transporter periplasmic adaptor subunit [unclassified Thioalkalivibrio]
MKIRFDSSSRRQANQDSGLKVRYGSARRVAFRLRWYLILLLVASPVLYFLYTLVDDALSTEVPALVWYPQHQLLAQVPGFVESIEVEPWDRIAQGDEVVRQHSPELERRERQIEDDLERLRTRAERTGQEQQSDLERRIELLRDSLSEFRAQEQRLEALFERGSANRGEVLPVRTERARVEERIAELEGDLARVPRGDAVESWPESLQLRHDDLLSDQAEVRQERRQLVKKADLDGVVTELLAEPGQFVAMGTPLLRYSGTRLRVVAYVEPRHLERRIERGREVTLILPDGERQKATVTATVGAADRLPAALRTGLGSADSTVPVIVEPATDLPEIWRVDRLPLRVKF